MFHQRILRLALAAFSCAALLGFASRVMAANLTVDPSNSSSVSATSQEDGTKSTSITGQGVFTATSGGNDPDSSSAIATITDTGNTLALSQVLAETNFAIATPDSSPVFTESGSEDLFFKFATNTAFDLTATYTVSDVVLSVSPDSLGPVPTGQLSASLYDKTTSTSVFNVSNSGGVEAPITLGPETGTLNAGDLYEFQASATLSTALGGPDPAGNGSITFAMTPGTLPIGGSVPLPAAALTGLIALLLAPIAKKKLVPAA